MNVSQHDAYQITPAVTPMNGSNRKLARYLLVPPSTTIIINMSHYGASHPNVNTLFLVFDNRLPNPRRKKKDVINWIGNRQDRNSGRWMGSIGDYKKYHTSTKSMLIINLIFICWQNVIQIVYTSAQLYLIRSMAITVQSLPRALRAKATNLDRPVSKNGMMQTFLIFNFPKQDSKHIAISISI